MPLKENIEKEFSNFSDIFCTNDFADSDYTIIQTEPYSFESKELWFKQVSLSTIFKCFTYIIWTSKANNGYLIRKIKDGTIFHLLERLEIILVNNDVSALRSTGATTFTIPESNIMN